jgi:hypothetical protein
MKNVKKIIGELFGEMNISSYSHTHTHTHTHTHSHRQFRLLSNEHNNLFINDLSLHSAAFLRCGAGLFCAFLNLSYKEKYFSPSRDRGNS